MPVDMLHVQLGVGAITPVWFLANVVWRLDQAYNEEFRVNIGEFDNIWMVLALIGFVGCAFVATIWYAVFAAHTASGYDRAITIGIIYFCVLSIECFEAIFQLRQRFNTFGILRAFWLFSELIVNNLGLVVVMDYMRRTYVEEKAENKYDYPFKAWMGCACFLLFTASVFEIAMIAELPPPLDALADDSMSRLYYVADAFGIIAAVIGFVTIATAMLPLSFAFYGVTILYGILALAADFMYVHYIQTATSPARDWIFYTHLPMDRIVFTMTLAFNMYIASGEFSDDEK
mmetsp:Transcript_22544/g.63281  ORF Transcript_22544/g.63281 Transcript_22544/m.63281 type:complete len:288 (+) Transcript_22544:206-1069(+)|eukprot:CAMPEP_0119125544 /NCGR_PEP_ID=MMETSP1310-20130426/4777_1 /TAXON_ID=464262 /ORGANISM="Genus nov. species nov., Strain RCC2339" /LENGTH=287 /DNA_ID=CAMNT_0007115619 /DNA_START=213 /DNA_END=1076 /DNA_ORIENTATION=+